MYVVHIRQQEHTQRLNIILIETALDIFDHETGLANLRIPHHPDLDYHTEEETGVVSAFGRSTRQREGRRTCSFRHHLRAAVVSLGQRRMRQMLSV